MRFIIDTEIAYIGKDNAIAPPKPARVWVWPSASVRLEF